jgi:hypothetical protein
MCSCSRQEQGRAASLSRQRQSATGRQTEGLGLTPGAQQDSPDGGAAQGLFPYGQKGLRVAHPHQQKVTWGQAHLMKPRPVRTACFLSHHLMQTPHDRPSRRRS